MKSKSLSKFDALSDIRVFSLPLLLAIALTVSSCGRSNASEPEPTAAPTSTTQSEATESDAEETEEEAPADVVMLPTPTPAAETETEEATTDESSADEEGPADAPHGGREGMAAYMSDEFHGQATASGLIYDKDAMMAAHKSLPFESEVIVTNPETGVSVTVIIVDRLPERAESIIDVSSAAAVELDMLDAGMVWVMLDPAGE